MSDRPRDFLAWGEATFGKIALDRQERITRFLEEAIELAQAENLPKEMIERILARVYSRAKGNIGREIGQAQATLEIYAESIGMSANDEADREFARVQSIPKEVWKERHAAKVALRIAG